MGFDVEFLSSDGSGTLSFPLHVRCFAVWELERDAGQESLDGAAPIARMASNGTRSLIAHENGGTIVNREHDDSRRDST
jgi:hypothetical protein